MLPGALVAGVISASRRLAEPEPVRRRAVVTTIAIAALWMGLTWIAAASGLLRDWSATPPPMVFLVAGMIALSCAVAFTGYGRRLVRGLPLWALVAFQSFRLPLELAMHAQYERGVMPEQMSYSGLNFDIVTGITAIVVAWLLATRRAGRRVALGWNILGFGLLLNIVVVSILSTPLFAFFGSDRLNVWVTYPPFVWLPAVMVLAALAGHLLIFRATLVGPDRVNAELAEDRQELVHPRADHRPTPELRQIQKQPGRSTSPRTASENDKMLTRNPERLRFIVVFISEVCEAEA